MMHLTASDLEAAQAIVYRHMLPTPQYAWPLLCAELGLEVWLKHENHTPTGAFKVRGGLVYLDALEKSGEAGDLVTATRGNHGQSIPYAARMYDRTVHVYVPEGNSPEKNSSMRGWGAQLHVHGRDFDTAREAAEARAREDGLHMVPSFHENLIRGVATYGYELMTQVQDLAAIYVPVGMGSGASSLIAVRDLLGLSTEIIGVVSNEADAMAQSLESGQIVETHTALTFADGMATRVPNEEAFAILQTGLERILRVSDDEIADAVRLIYRTTHNIAEGAGAAALAAVKQDRERWQGSRVAAILSGGNIDQTWFAEILSGQTPELPS